MNIGGIDCEKKGALQAFIPNLARVRFVDHRARRGPEARRREAGSRTRNWLTDAKMAWAPIWLMGEMQ